MQVTPKTPVSTLGSMVKVLLGRKIVKVDLRAFPTSPTEVGYNPVFVLDDGQVLWFTIERPDPDLFSIKPCIDQPGRSERRRLGRPEASVVG